MTLLTSLADMMGRSRYSIRQAMERTRRTIVRQRSCFILHYSAWICCIFIVSASAAIAAHLRQCEEADYYFQYTECDSTGSRWRVAIPLNPGECTGLPEPVQGTDCTFSCKAGEFLEMSAQECTRCAAGTYSLGSGLRFDEWDDIPPGFSSLAPNGQNASTCSSAKWVAQGSYLESNRDECTVSLIYTVHLKKPGSVSFDYQYVDNSIFFEFFIQNDQCQEMDQESNRKWIKLTTHGEWGTHSVNLNSGTNILYWRTTRVTLDSKAVKPVILKNIRIDGVAYTSECFPCKPGTFSRAPGSSSCEPCPRDTYSGRGASSCTPCNSKTHFASEGSATCKSRPPCSEKDYIQTYSTCDKDGKTQVIYKWVEPQICLEAAAGAVTLPPSGQREPCPPCNPGFYNNDTATCSPCPPGTYSDGVKACQPCPAGTEPVLGYEYKWWNVLPANMNTSCFNVANNNCDGLNGWEAAGDHVQSGAGRSDNDYLILNLAVPGFKLPVSVRGASGGEYGRITFEFETNCSTDCEFYFMEDVDRRSTNVIESWDGSKTKQSYTHIITENSSVTFTWAFQRTSQATDVRQYVNDMVKIYSVSVTNAMDGVASVCRACALQSQRAGSSCVPCPAGHYIDKETNQCQECPPNTVLSGHHIYGKEACQLCGPGSKSNKEHSVCFSDCSFTYTDQSRTLQYDFSALTSAGSIMNGPSFTAKGTKYYHLFNVSLCGAEGHKTAVCRDNVTNLPNEDTGGGQQGSSVEAFLCQSTIIPSDGRGLRTALSSQSISLADTFQGATVEKSLNGITARPELFPSASKRIPDIHFFYRSSQVTTSCPRGRNAVLSLRCNPEKTAKGDISIPSECPAGTCDGCTFHFLWESSSACPRCTAVDYHAIEGACKAGVQDTVFVWTEPRLCTGGLSLPLKRMSPCETIDFWLKVGAGLGVFSAILLVSLTCYFWKKNKKLEFKYSKLVMSANKECELPIADSCAIMEGEGEENEEEEVVYANKSSLLAKLKAVATKKGRRQLIGCQQNNLVEERKREEKLT
ncbi:endosome/lysosome-associated apoptosis and autophagy regulator family member 2-like isoform X1 [Carassius carassius]|uniref:endosome/lysosome-associated apoptosis and autophagy regulator family member 2-like isoform X1 n=1 Tax=Carassius carassius TaxID=217509 RepID=UPI002868F6E2|nr:endosome/lysosome-associated apoptosis and autophagy regulator family member 2-like isoform X1 [Carassius carassius]